MKILVLGGSYFIGKAIVSQLANCGKLTILNRGSKPNDQPHAELMIADRSIKSQLSPLQTRKFDVVVDISGEEASFVENTLSQLTHTPDKYIFISSSAVYLRQKGNALPLSESADLGGDWIWDDYGRQKYGCEKKLRDFPGKVYLLRPPYVYGPGNYLERESFLWQRLLAKKPILVPSKGETLIQFLLVSDLAKMVKQIVLDAGNEIAPGPYNVGDSHFYTFNSYIEILSEIAGCHAEIRYVSETVRARDYFPFRDNHIFLDVRKQDEVFGCTVPLKVGLSETYKWFTAHQLANLKE